MPQTSYFSGTSPSGAQNAVGGTPGGLAQNFVGCCFTGTAQVITSGTSASSWVPAGVGSVTLPANFLVAGKTVRVRCSGVITTQATPGTSQLNVSLGASAIVATGANTPTASISTLFTFEFDVTCQTAGSSGTCSFTAVLMINGVTNYLFAPSGSGTAINTTVSNTLAITTTNSVSGGAVFTINQFTMEVLN